MDLFDRIEYIVDIETNGNINSFSRKAGINPETLRSSLKKRKSFPSYDVLSRILKTYYWVNPDWLMLGNEPIERIEANNERKLYEVIEEYKKKENRLLTIIESQQRTIEQLSTQIKNEKAPEEKNTQIGKGA